VCSSDLLYPLLGYAILPLLVPGVFAMVYVWRVFASQGAGGLPSIAPWAWALLVPAVPFTVWALASICISVVKRDWIFGTLMLLPLSALVGWLLVLGSHGLLAAFPTPALESTDGGIAMTFLALALSTGCFVRLRQRRMKVAVLLGTALAVWVVVAQVSPQGLSLWGLTLLGLLLFGLLLSPVLLEARVAPRDKASAKTSSYLEQPESLDGGRGLEQGHLRPRS
jgi:hypothetical protein